MAEVSVFPNAPVAEPKSGVVEARLHYDTHTPSFEARIRGLFDEYEIGDTRPVYVLVDVETGAELRRFDRAPLLSGDDEAFAQFLRGGGLD